MSEQGSPSEAPRWLRYARDDLLVVFEHAELENKRELAVDIHRAITGVPVDIVVTDVDEIYRQGHIVGTVLRSALREGRVVYERP